MYMYMIKVFPIKSYKIKNINKTANELKKKKERRKMLACQYDDEVSYLMCSF